MTRTLDPYKYLQRLTGLGIRMDLGAVRGAFAALGNPAGSYPSVLVGGTNGKGSVAAMTASILAAAGRSVGLYTSPHLVDVRERIRINDRMISRQELAEAITAIDRLLPEPLTYFEFLTVLAGFYFRSRGVDLAVVEVGMGGRLDATRAFASPVTVITNISLDHQEYLGSRLVDIAGEKAAIVPRGGQCITGVRQAAAVGIIAAVCRERGASLRRLGQEIKVCCRRDGTFTYRDTVRRFSGLSCGLAGRHQRHNAALAVAAAPAVAGGSGIPEEAVHAGLSGVHWEGRLEVLHEDPPVVIDGAHNPAGIGTLCRALAEGFSYRRLIVVFGVLRDKEYRRMMGKLAALRPRLILTCPAGERALPPGELKKLSEGMSLEAEVVPSPPAALRRALAVARRGDLVCVTGSLYLVGEIKKAFPSLRTMIAAQGK